MNDEKLLQGEGIFLRPYVQVDGAYTVPDTFLLWLWARYEEEGTTAKVFRVSEVADGADFIDYMRMPGNLPVLFFADDQTPLGMAWLNGVSGNHAFVHHALLKASWGRLTDAIAKVALGYWFGMRGASGFQLDVLVGMTPSVNSKAVKYLQRVGFTVVGQIPQMAEGEPMTISYLERDNG